MAYDITMLRRKVVNMYPYFGSVAAGVEYHESEKIKSIKSNEKNIYYNPNYMAGLTIEDQIFVFAHELCHIAFRHHVRSKGKEKIIWDTATDAVINQLLKKDGLEIMKGEIDYPEAIDYDAEEYYEMLLARKLAIDVEGGEIAGQSGAGDSNNLNDRTESNKFEEEDDENESNSDYDMFNQNDSETENEEDNDDDAAEDLFRKLAEMAEDDDEVNQPQQKGEEQDEDDDSDDDEDEEFKLTAVRDSSSGNSQNPDVRSVDAIGTSKPLLDWRLLLRDTIHHGYDWSYSNAVIENGIVRPVLEEMPMPETEIVLDTSWSVDEDLLRNFLRECKNILPISKLKVGCFDTMFYGFHDIRTEKDIEKVPFEGGGGTDFDVAVNAFTLRVDNRIIFTDGEAPMPEKPLNVIWVVYGDEKIEPPGGTVIHIKPEWLMGDK